MYEEKTSSTPVRGGVYFSELLQLAFIILKLTKVISWPWWAVLMPTIISAAFTLVGVTIYLVFILVAYRKGGKK